MAKPDPLTDQIRRVAEQRDKTAFAALFDHFAPRLKSYLVRLGADAASAEELTQEVMITLWRKAHHDWTYFHQAWILRKIGLRRSRM